MATWEWTQWALLVLVVGVVALAAYQYGNARKVSRDVLHAGVALALTVAVLLTLN